MNSCINTDAAEYRALKECSGLSDFQLKVAIRTYLKEHENQWPKLDEIPGANSEESLRETLKIHKDGSAKIEHVLKVTNTNSPEEATIYLNNKYRDLNVEVFPLHEDAIINIEHRPSPFNIVPAEAREINVVNSQVFINQALETLKQRLGIEVISKTSKELQREGIFNYVPEGALVSAFILDGNIVVNTDVASVDAPVHELMHVLLGSVKYTYPDLYRQLTLTARQLPSYNKRAALYPHRSLLDIDEEVFVEEYAKFLSGILNEFIDLNPEIIYLLNYEMSRTLDTILNGDNSVRAIPEALRFGESLKNLGYIVNSKNMESKYQGFADNAHVARVLANMKSDLFKSKKLEEIC